MVCMVYVAEHRNMISNILPCQPWKNTSILEANMVKVRHDIFNVNLRAGALRYLYLFTDLEPVHFFCHVFFSTIKN